MPKTLQDYINEGYEVVKQPQNKQETTSLDDYLSQGYQLVNDDELKQYKANKEKERKNKLQSIKDRLAQERETTLDTSSQTYKDMLNPQPKNDMSTTTQKIDNNLQEPEQPKNTKGLFDDYNSLSPTLASKNIDKGKTFKESVKYANKIDNAVLKSLYAGVQKGVSDFYKLIPGFSQTKFLNKTFIQPGQQVYKYNAENNPLPKTVNTILNGFGKMAFDIPTTIGTGAGVARVVEGKVSEEIAKLLSEHTFAVGSFLEGVDESAQQGDNLGKSFENGLYNASQAEVYQHIDGKDLSKLAQMMGAGATFTATDKIKNGQHITVDDIAEGAATGAAVHLIFKGMDLAEKGLTKASEKIALKYAKKKFEKYADEYMKAHDVNAEQEEWPKQLPQNEPQPEEPKQLEYNPDIPQEDFAQIQKEQATQADNIMPYNMNAFGDTSKITKEQSDKIKNIASDILKNLGDESQETLNDVVERAKTILANINEQQTSNTPKEKEIKSDIKPETIKQTETPAKEVKTEEEHKSNIEPKHQNIEEIDTIPDNIKKVRVLPSTIMAGLSAIETADGFIGSHYMVIDKKYINKSLGKRIDKKREEDDYNKTPTKAKDISTQYTDEDAINPEDYIGYDDKNGYIYKDKEGNYVPVNKADIDYVIKNIPNAKLIFHKNKINDGTIASIYANKELAGVVSVRRKIEEDEKIKVLKNTKEVENDKGREGETPENKRDDNRRNNVPNGNIQNATNTNAEGLPQEMVSKDEKGKNPEQTPGRGSNKDVGDNAVNTIKEKEPRPDISDVSEGDSTRILHKGRVSSGWQGYVLKDDDEVLTTPATRYDANLEAIKILKNHEISKEPFTDEELNAISKYSGFGGINALINPKTSVDETRNHRLSKLVDNYDYLTDIKRSARDAFYTPTQVVANAWDIANAMGLSNVDRTIRALEPSVGIGRFIGLTPETVRGRIKFTAIEKDKISSMLVSALYPNVNTTNKGFEESDYKNHFDLVIGNPPYGAQNKILDKKDKSLSGLNIHEYFSAKSLKALKPGGVQIFFTSSNFLDHISDRMLDYLKHNAYFVGALRYPDNTYKTTKVIADMVVLRKLRTNEKSNIEQTISETGKINNTPINKYFEAHPQYLLGYKWEKGKTFNTLSPLSKEEHNDRIKTFLNDIKSDIFNKIESTKIVSAESDIDESIPVNTLYVDGKSVYINYVENEILKREKVRAVNSTIKDYIKVRSTLNKLVNAEKTNNKDTETLRKELNKAYDKFCKAHGRLNDPKNLSNYEIDSDRSKVLSLERGSELDKLKKADIFTKPTIVNKENPKVKASSPTEAVALSIFNKGKIDISYMAEITGVSEEKILNQTLYKDIYYDPQEGYIPAHIYLSGDVKTKYAQTTDEKNKKALLKVFPKDKEIYDIDIDIGADWIGIDIINKFAEYLGYPSNAIRKNLNGTYEVAKPLSYYKDEKFYTKYKKQKFILEYALNGKLVQHMTINGKPAPRQDIEDVNTAIDSVKEEFINIVYENQEIKRELEKRFNEKQNRWVKEKESPFTDKYKIPDVQVYSPRDYQTNAVFKSVFKDKPILLNHTMGAGKSLTSAMIAMEWVRTGRAKKVMIITPKASMKQYADDFLTAYPSANIIIATDKTFTKKYRSIFLSSIMTNNPDVIVISHDQFKMIPQPKEIALDLMRKKKAEIEAEIKESNEKKSRTARTLAAALDKVEKEIDLLSSKKDDSVPAFDMLGVDGLIVDEAHNYKNLYFPTKVDRVAGMPTAKSQKAWDMYVKSRHILSLGNNFVMMTGTPLTNTIPEIYVLQKYLQENDLERLHLSRYDEWHKQFTKVVGNIVYGVGGDFSVKSTLSNLANQDVLSKMVGSITDTIDADDLNNAKDINIPELVGNKPTMVMSEQTQIQKDYNEKIKERLERVKSGMVDPSEDNFLKLYHDAKISAIDPRLIDANAPSPKSGKIAKLVDNTYKKYKEYDNEKGAQLIFCDIGVPNNKSSKKQKEVELLVKKAEEGDEEASNILNTKYSQEEIDDILFGNGFNLYQDIKQRLIAKGIPEKEIAFIHSFKTDDEKKKLSNDVNSGKIRVVLGTRTKLGVGLNMQKRLVAVHQVDIPYRADQINQSNGRILRQGNEILKKDPNFKAEIFYYSTENTVDARLWGILKRKASWIKDFWKGKKITDIGEESQDEQFAALEAVTSGNPLLIERMQLKKKISSLNAKKRMFESRKADLIEKKKTAESLIKRADNIINDFGRVITTLKTTKGIEINGKKYKEVKNSAKDIIKLAKKYEYTYGQRMATGKMGDLEFELISGDPKGRIVVTNGVSWGYGNSFSFNPAIMGAFTRVVNSMLNKYEKNYDKFKLELANAKNVVNKSVDNVFSEEKELQELNKRYKQVQEEMRNEASPQTKTEETEEAEDFLSYSPQKAKDVADIIKKSEPKTAEDLLKTEYNAKTEQKKQPNNPKLYKEEGEKLIPKFKSIIIDGKSIKQPDNPIYPADIKKLYKKLVGDIFYYGNLSKDNLGTYARQWGAMRTKHLFEVEIISHEIGHYFQFNSTTKDNFKDFINENKDIINTYSYTDNTKIITSEGFAELVRAYFTRANDIEPELYKKLDDTMKVLKKYALIKEIQKQSHFYFHQGAENLTKSAIEPDKKILDVYDDFVHSFKSNVDLTITKFFDTIHPVKVIMKDVGLKSSLEKNNPYIIANNAIYGNSSTIEAFVRFGTGKRDKDGEIHYVGQSLTKVFSSFSNNNKPVSKRASEKQLNEIYKYMQLRQSKYQIEKQGKKSPFGNIEIINAEIKRLEKENPNFRRGFVKWLRFNKDLLDYLVSSYAISEKTKKAFLKANPLYVPQHRVVGKEDSGMLKGFKRRTKEGSERQLKSIENLFTQIENSITMGNRAFVTHKIIEILEEHDNAGEWLAPIKKGTAKYQAILEQQANHFISFLKDNDLSLDTDGNMVDKQMDNMMQEFVYNYLLKHPEAMTFYKGGQRPYSIDGNIISDIDDNGNINYYEINNTHEKGKLLIEMFNGIESPIPLFTPFVKIRNIVTRSIVSFPPFMAANTIRDTFTALVYGKAWHIPAVSTVSGAISTLTEDYNYKMLMLNGMSAGTLAKGIIDEGRKGQIAMSVNSEVSLRKVLNVLDVASGISELPNRILEGKSIIKKTGSYQAGSYASSTVTVNFGRYGSNKWFRSWGKTVPFFSAYINSNFKDMLEFSGGEIYLPNDSKSETSQRLSAILSLALKGLVFLSIPSLIITIYTMINKEREKKWTELPDYVGALNEPIIIDGKVYKIPRSWVVNIAFAQIPETALRVFLHKHGAKATRELLLSIKLALTGATTPAAISPFLSMSANKDFRGKAIIPDRLKNLTGKQSYLQRKSYTPLLYVDLSKRAKDIGVNISPIKMQYYIDNFLGYAARTAEGYAQLALWDKKRWGEMPYARYYTLQGQTAKRFIYPDYGTMVNATKYNKIIKQVRSIINAYNIAKGERAKDGGNVLNTIRSDKTSMRIIQEYKNLSNKRKLITKSYKRSERITIDKSLTGKEKENRLRQETNYRDRIYGVMYKRYTKILKGNRNGR